MSAIFGIINKNGRPADEQHLSVMQRSLAHRASDGFRHVVSDAAAMGYLRLAVYAQQEGEALPMSDNELLVVADALIYNRNELYSKLGIPIGTIFPDAHLIPLAYRKWGMDCVHHLDGEFSFVIYNKRSGEIFAATDHMGFRPLYYHDDTDQFVFATEMRAVRAVKNTPDIFNPQVIIGSFFRQGDFQRTYNRDIFALAGGSMINGDRRGISVTRYWQPGRRGRYHFSKTKEWAECLRELLFASVENRMHTDRPVGVTLSGGLDSSTVACIAGKILEKRNKTLWAFSSVLEKGYTGIEQDERHYISVIGKHLKNLEQVYVEAPDAGPFNGLEEAFDIDEGIPNAFFYMDHAINKAARTRDVRVLFSGFGGDFFVSWKGNSVIYQLLKQLNLTDALKIFRETKKYEQQSFAQLLKTEIIAHTKMYEHLYPLLHRNKINWKYETTIHKGLLQKFGSVPDFSNEPDQRKIMTGSIENGALSSLTRLFANRDAHYGMMTAMPLFDRNVIEFLYDVPISEFRTNGTRRSLLRNAMEGLVPAEVLWRKDKMPYSPDYISRLIKNKQLINSILADKEYNFAWTYIDKEKIREHIDKVKPVKGMGFASEISGIRIIQGIITAAFIKWLMLNNYELDK